MKKQCNKTKIGEFPHVTKAIDYLNAEIVNYHLYSKLDFAQAMAKTKTKPVYFYKRKRGGGFEVFLIKKD